MKFINLQSILLLIILLLIILFVTKQCKNYHYLYTACEYGNLILDKQQLEELKDLLLKFEDYFLIKKEKWLAKNNTAAQHQVLKFFQTNLN
jgi:hypothetical protein